MPRLDAVDERLGPKGAPDPGLDLGERIELGRSLAARLSR
jgi:hypothetical protein